MTHHTCRICGGWISDMDAFLSGYCGDCIARLIVIGAVVLLIIVAIGVWKS